MEFQQIKDLISLVDSTDITDFEIENKGCRIRIRKERKETNPVPSQRVEQLTLEPVVSTPEQVVETYEGLVAVTAPMVGTFYRSPAPDAEPFVQVGEAITQGQILYIIEAMKMMNEIESEVKGVVKQILVENGEPVEYGQPLLLIDPKA
ncbi:MAG TPA: acetyl-CoA carboxylase biotin carboxyl carrier protein [Firmicutes bacterium]|jgi:acetyl-CoA carboxylase biotin carboxyl carrier protein|nr:acetyl-CoA carboxylase biotin carboxyl carrier protein [Bacillota bacterium]